MKIPHWFFWDYLTGYEGDKDQSYFDAYVFIKAIKREEFNGHLRVKDNKGRPRRLHHKDSAVIAKLALTIIGKNHIPKIVTQATELVPIPNSDMIPKSGETHKIIKAGTQLIDGYDKSDAEHELILNSGLRWTIAKDPAHKTGGVRSMSQYEGKFSLTSKIENPVILFDDVYTSGSQAKAACKFLTELGHEVIGVVTLAKTTHTPTKKAYKWREDICEYGESPFDWDDF